jgi:hypothetical protein
VRHRHSGAPVSSCDCHPEGAIEGLGMRSFALLGMPTE